MENAQTKQEFFKYEIQKFIIDYLKTVAKKRIFNLKLKQQNIESNLNSKEN